MTTNLLFVVRNLHNSRVVCRVLLEFGKDYFAELGDRVLLGCGEVGEDREHGERRVRELRLRAGGLEEEKRKRWNEFISANILLLNGELD